DETVRGLDLERRRVRAAGIDGEVRIRRAPLRDRDVGRGGGQRGGDRRLIRAAGVLDRDVDVDARGLVDDAVAVAVDGVVDRDAIRLQVRRTGHAETLGGGRTGTGDDEAARRRGARVAADRIDGRFGGHRVDGVGAEAAGHVDAGPDR